MESQNISRPKAPRLSRDVAKKLDKRDVETNTESKTNFCQNCWQLKLLDPNTSNPCEPVDQHTILNYKKAINYINSCHTIINEYFSKSNNQRCIKCNVKSEDTPNVIMPDLPDFITLLSSLSSLNKNGLCFQCSQGDWSSKSRTGGGTTSRRSSSRPRTASSIYQRSRNDSDRTLFSPSAEYINKTDKRKSSHHNTRRKHRASSNSSAEPTVRVQPHPKHPNNSRKVNVQTIPSKYQTDESDYDLKTESQPSKTVSTGLKKSRTTHFEEKGDKSESDKCETPGKEDLETIRNLYTIIGQQLLQGSQTMPIQKVIEILKSQAFFQTLFSESQNNSSVENSQNTSVIQSEPTTEPEKFQHNGRRPDQKFKIEEQNFPPKLVSQKDIDNYTAELLQNNHRTSFTETTTPDSVLQKEESKRISNTKIPTAVKKQITKHFQSFPSRNKHSDSNLVSSSSNDQQILTSDDHDGYDSNTSRDPSPNVPQNSQPFVYSAEGRMGTNMNVVQQASPPYVVQQKQSDHFVCNRANRKARSRNVFSTPPRNLEQQQQHYHDNSTIQNIPEESEYGFSEEKNHFKYKQPEKNRLSNVSSRSRTDSSEIETDKDEIIRQFTPRKIIIDSSGATTKMKCPKS